jgi:hypothetical protein
MDPARTSRLDTPDYRNPDHDALLQKAVAIFNHDKPVISLSYDNWPRW